jgi:DNA repair protein SbcC/Rad50
MIPYKLTLKNFMCYRGEHEPLRFDGLHTICLSGENGAGKSALLDAITWALWGKARLSDDDGLIAQGAYDMLVDLVFQLGQDFYRVKRQRQRSTSGKRTSGKSSLDLQIKGEQGWKVIGAATIRETEREIEALLRMNYDTFINASFFIQGRADEFTRKTPGERKQVLADILDLRDYARLEEQAKERGKNLKEQVQRLDGLISHLEQESEKQHLYETLVGEAEAKAAKLTAMLHTAEAEKEAADEQVRTIEAKLQRRKTLANELTKQRAHLRQQEQERAETQAAITESETLIARAEEIATGIQSLEQAKQHLADLDALRPRYDDLQEQRRQHQDELKDVARTLQSEKDGLQREIRRLEEQIAQRPDIEARIAELGEQLAALEPLAANLRDTREQRDQLDERISQANTHLHEYSDLASTLAQRHNELTTQRNEHQRTVQRLEKQLADGKRWQADLEEALAHRQQAHEHTETLSALRSREQTIAEQVGERRARCTSVEQQAEDIKKRQALLSENETTTCPLCRSHLGEDGISTIATHYEQEIVSLREQYRQARDEANTLEQELAQVRQEIATTEQQLASLQKSAARGETLQQQLAQAEQWRAELEQARASLATIEEHIASEAYEPETREQLRATEEALLALGAQRQKGKKQPPFTIAPLEKERTALNKKQANLEQQLEGRVAIESERATLCHRLEELTQAAAALPDQQQRMTELDATIANGDFGHDIREKGRAVEAQIAELGYTPEAHREAQAAVQERAHWSDEAHQLEVARNTLERDQRTIQRIDELLQQYHADEETLLKEDAQLEQEVRDYPAVRQHASDCAERVATGRRSLDAANHDLAEKRTLLKGACDAAAQLEQRQSERKTLAGQQSIFEELAKACGKEGVQAMLIETAVPEIERETNRLLGRMTDNQMHVALDMQRNTKKGTTKETLDITISDALGTRDYSSFSGGEAMRINFAIRIALSRLLARRAGASLETLIIDEGFGALDADGRERFVEAITSVQNDFKRIIVISHIDDLKERFPTQIQITKRPDGSVWEIL